MKKGIDINIFDFCKVRNRYYYFCLVERGNKNCSCKDVYIFMVK